MAGKAVPFRQLGNYVLASCGTNGLVSLRNFTPAGGWQVDDDVQHGPAAEAEVKFEGPDSDLKVRVQCQAGVPVFTPEVQPDESDD